MRSDATANRDALVAAARHAIRSSGTDFTLTAVATDAQVGIATLYRHFPTRTDLVVAVAHDIEHEIVTLIDAVVGRLDADPARAWSEYVHGLATIGPSTLVVALIGAADSRSGRELYATRDRVFGRERRILTAAVEAGLLRPDVDARAFHLGLAAVSRPLPDVLVPGGVPYRPWLVDVYLRGLHP